MSANPGRGSDALSALLDDAKRSGLQFRIDNFAVPDEARDEFDMAMHRIVAFLETLPGFLGHTVFEKTGGKTAFNIVTLAAWESKDALEAAGSEARAFYKRLGIDMPAMLARWGVRAELGLFIESRTDEKAFDRGAAGPVPR